MVLTSKNKIVFLIFIFYFNTIFIFAYSRSGLIQYGDNIDRERLELLEDRQIIQLLFDENTRRNRWQHYMITGTYVIRNSGSEYQTSLGILFQEISDISSPEGIQFFINNERINHYSIKNQGSVNFGEERIRLSGLSTYWTLIDVIFPEKSTITIKVQYIDIFYEIDRHSEISYNHPTLEYFLDLLYWKGPTKFSIEIINDNFRNNETVEYFWISNISFVPLETERSGNKAYNNRDERYNLNVKFQTLQDLETYFIKIQRRNGNTLLIEFDEDFYKTYYRCFIIDYRSLTPGISSYIRLTDNSILLNNLDEHFRVTLQERINISRRLLGPYELIFLTDSQLRVMRNAFYAQYGYVFSSRDLQETFERIVGYSPNPNFNENMLTEIDRNNIETIFRIEENQIIDNSGNVDSTIETQNNIAIQDTQECDNVIVQNREKKSSVSFWVWNIIGITVLSVLIVFVVVRRKRK